MKTDEIAKKLVEYCRKGENMKAIDTLYDKNIVSVEAREGPEMPRQSQGIEAAKKKTKWWMENATVHNMKVGEPYVSQEKFAVVYDMEVTWKPMNKRMKMSEIGVYTVKQDKIVHEEFLGQECK